MPSPRIGRSGHALIGPAGAAIFLPQSQTIIDEKEIGRRESVRLTQRYLLSDPFVACFYLERWRIATMARHRPAFTAIFLASIKTEFCLRFTGCDVANHSVV